MSEINIRLNYLQGGIIFGFILDSEHRDTYLKSVYEQFIEIKKQIEKEGGVEKELLPNGLLRITDSGGTVIIRPPQDWETLTFKKGM